MSKRILRHNYYCCSSFLRKHPNRRRKFQRSSLWILSVCASPFHSYSHHHHPSLVVEAFGSGVSLPSVSGTSIPGIGHRRSTPNYFASLRPTYNNNNRRPNTMSTLSSSHLGMAKGENESDVSHSGQAFTVCPKCQGEGKLSLPATRKARKRHKLADNNNNASNDNINANNNQQQQKAPPRIDGCKVCQGSGLVVAQDTDTTNTRQVIASNDDVIPHVAIVGGGLGGLALAVACKHRSIPFTVYERDDDFFQRSQGYGLTMQQASRALKALGIPVPLAEGIVSTKHVVHTPDGSVVGEWGLRKWADDGDKKSASNMEQHKKQAATSNTNNTPNNNNKTNGGAKSNKRQNVHIARQSLRFELLKALGGPSHVQWGHRLSDFTEKDNGVDLVFEVSASTDTTPSPANKEVKHERATLLVGADGIRSAVRKQWLGDDDQSTTPLRYLGCIVILGICPLSSLSASVMSATTGMAQTLLDGETVFQTADGSTRIYMMPYSKNEYMWQLSFPMEEDTAKSLSRRGPQALKAESLKMCDSWHDPIMPILQATPTSLVSGYPVYDRDLLTKEMLQKHAAPSSQSPRRITLLGDACHPMSPFKGQGANQALLDALSLARILYKRCRANSGDGNNKSGGSQRDNIIESSQSQSAPEGINTASVILQRSLEAFEEEMLGRSSVKVKASAEAARFLHTKVAIQEGNVTRGAAANTTRSKFG